MAVPNMNAALWAVGHDEGYELARILSCGFDWREVIVHHPHYEGMTVLELALHRVRPSCVTALVNPRSPFWLLLDPPAASLPGRDDVNDALDKAIFRQNRHPTRSRIPRLPREARGLDIQLLALVEAGASLEKVVKFRARAGTDRTSLPFFKRLVRHGDITNLVERNRELLHPFIVLRFRREAERRDAVVAEMVERVGGHEDVASLVGEYMVGPARRY